MKKISCFFLAVSILLLTACPPEVIVDPKEALLKQKVEAVVSPDLMKTIKGMGMPIHDGINPPNIEGKYLADDLTMKKSNYEDDDPPGTKYEEEVLTISGQNNENFTVTLKSEIGSYSYTYSMVISGSGDKFTLYTQMETQVDDNTRVKTVVLYSGRMKDGELHDLHIGAFISEKPNYELGQVFYEADGVAKKTDKPEEPITSSTVGKDGGKLSVKNIHVSIPAGSFAADTKMELKKQTEENVFGKSKASEYYTITGIPVDFSKPVTITVTPDENAGANLFMAMGEESFVPSSNRTKLTYSLVESTLKDGKYVFELQPCQPDKGSNGEKMDLTFGLVKDFVQTGRRTKSSVAGNRFNVCYCKYHVHDYEAEQFEKYLNAAYDELVKMGFSFSRRTSWPVQIMLNNRMSDGPHKMGEFAPSRWGNDYAHIEFNFGAMPSEDLLKSTAGHELFHLVQALYDNRYAAIKARWPGPLYWIDEAASTWFEEVMAGKGYSSITRKDNELYPFVGIYRGPTVNPQDYGYGMAAFIKSLVGQTDKTILLQIYEKRFAGADDPVKIINEISPKTIMEIYPYFLEEYLTKKIYPDFDHSKLLAGIEHSGIQKWVIQSKEDTLQTFDNLYDGISARVFLVKLPYTGFKDGDMLKIETDNTIFIPKYVFEVKDNKYKLLYMGRGEFSVPNLKQLQKENGQVMVLVANAGYTEDKVETTFTVKSQPEQFITLTTAKAVGETITMYLDGYEGVWIDLNNNGKEEAGEEVELNSRKSYTLGAKTIRIYGEVTVLDCNNNQLTAINLGSNQTLKGLSCIRNQLTALDVSGNTTLKGLGCGENQLTALDVSGCNMLEELYCEENELTSLNINGCTILKRLVCPGNRITSLNVNGYTLLEKLDCEDNQLSSLNVSECTALKELICGYNKLTSLNASGCTALKTLFCDKNQLAALKLSGCTALTDLSCKHNRFTSLNLSGYTTLKYLSCNDNQLTSLNLSGCTALLSLQCQNNQLTSLNLSGFTSLYTLDCSNNNICEVIPAIFDKISNLSYDIRYEYGWDDTKNKNVVLKDHGKGYWYDHEPEGGCHAPKPCNN